MVACETFHYYEMFHVVGIVLWINNKVKLQVSLKHRNLSFNKKDIFYKNNYLSKGT